MPLTAIQESAIKSSVIRFIITYDTSLLMQIKLADYSRIMYNPYYLEYLDTLHGISFEEARNWIYESTIELLTSHYTALLNCARVTEPEKPYLRTRLEREKPHHPSAYDFKDNHITLLSPSRSKEPFLVPLDRTPTDSESTQWRSYAMLISALHQREMCRMHSFLRGY